MGTFTTIKKISGRYNGLVLLNIAGLALGLTSVIFIAIWIIHELSYDKFYKNADRIFRVESLLNMTGEPSVWKITPAPVAKSLCNDFPEVEDAVILQTGFSRSMKVDDKLFKTPNLYFTEHSFFKIFTPEVISGDTSRLLTGPLDLVISRHIAESLFGNSDPVGRQVLFNNKDLLTVTAIIEDSPLNTHLRVDYLVPFSLLKDEEPDLESWGRINFMTYVLLKEHTDAAGFNRKLADYWASKSKVSTRKFFINPLTRLYLYRDPGLSDEKYPYSDKGLINRVILFSVIGFMILLIACINFINLSTAFASQRAREIGIRKVNGAGRTNLVLHLFGESVLQTSLATIIALILVVVLLPVFSNICNVEFRVRELFSMKNIFIYIALTLLTGFVAGTYPALVLSSFNPVKVIRPMPDDVVQGSGLRKVLVVIQFSLSFIFIFCTMIMNRQLSYMQEFDLGFDKEQVMVIYPHSRPAGVDVIAEQIEKLPGIKQVAIGGNTPVNTSNFNTFSKWDGNNDGQQLIFLMMQVEDDYLDLLDIPIVAGRNFFKGSYAEEVIINETAARKMGFEDPIGKFIWNGEKRFPIVGVVRDFHTNALREEIQPVMIFKSESWWKKWIFVKLEPGSRFSTTADVLKVVEKNEPGYPVNYLFLDEEAGKYYDNEKRLNTLVNAATILTIVISCIGLFSLTAFTIRRKQKEIGVRKAYGATISTVLIMLQKEFGKLVLISCLVSIPAGYYIIKRWLNSYTSHISVSPFYFIVSILIILVISALTLFYHSYRAASANPATTLRNE
jgi:ABC-type antimicrobial peptide transport system permease subunit